MSVAMTAAAGITLDLNAPPPREPFYSLLKSLRALDPSELIEGDDERWINGVDTWGYPMSLPETWDQCSTGTFRSKTEGEGMPGAHFDAFGLYIPVTCSTFGMGDWRAFRDRALVALEATQSFAVERVLAAGVDLTTNDNPYFGDTNVNIVGGAAVAAETGLSWLEQEIAQSGRMGIIHAPPEVAVRWPLELFPDGTMRTRAGTLVAIGAGYSGVSANGVAPASGQSYAFATGAVRVYLSEEITFSEGDLNGTLNTQTNVVTFRAEKVALAIWEGLAPEDDFPQAAAVLVDWTP